MQDLFKVIFIKMSRSTQYELLQESPFTTFNNQYLVNGFCPQGKWTASTRCSPTPEQHHLMEKNTWLYSVFLTVKAALYNCCTIR